MLDILILFGFRKLKLFMEVEKVREH